MSALPSAAILGLMLLSVALLMWPRPIAWSIARRFSVVSESAYGKRHGKRGPGERVYVVLGLAGLCVAIALLLLNLEASGELSLPRVYGALLLGTMMVAFSMGLPPVYASTRRWFTGPEPREGEILYDVTFSMTRVSAIVAAVVFVWGILRG